MMNNGLQATIILYNNCDDINIKFENGKIVYGRSYRSFKNGNIKCPMIFEYIDDYCKAINPNTGFSFLIDKEDVNIVDGVLWSENSDGYARGFVDGRKQLLHRLIMNVSDCTQVDHIYGDKTDNRKCKLRPCINAENQRNQSKPRNNTSGFKGVHWNKAAEKWTASICLNNQLIHLGYFSDKLEAAQAYNNAAIKYHAKFAKLNAI